MKTKKKTNSSLFKVHFLEYDEESGMLGKSIYSHRAGEIWRMTSSPTDYRRFATIYQTSQYLSKI